MHQTHFKLGEEYTNHLFIELDVCIKSLSAAQWKRKGEINEVYPDNEVILDIIHNYTGYSWNKGGDNYNNGNFAKNLFEINDNEELIRKITLIDYRLKKWVKARIFHKIKPEKVNMYSVNIKRVYFGNGKLSVNGITLNMGDCLILKL